MRSLVITIVAIAVLGLLAITNPKMPDYEQYIHTKIIRKNDQADDLTKALATLFSGLQSSLIANATTRSDYIFFSVFETKLGGDTVEYLGALNNFIELKSSTADGEKKPK